GEPGFAGIALALLQLQLGFEDVGVGDLAAALAILAHGKIFLGVGLRLLGGGALVLRREQAVEIGGDGRRQAASGDFGLRPRQRRAGAGLGKRGGRAEIEGFVQIALARVLVDSVVGDVAVALGVDVAGVVVERRQQSGARLGLVGGGDALGHQRGLEVGRVGAG